MSQPEPVAGKLVYAPEDRITALSRSLHQQAVLPGGSYEVVADVRQGKVLVSRRMFELIFEVVD